MPTDPNGVFDAILDLGERDWPNQGNLDNIGLLAAIRLEEAAPGTFPNLALWRFSSGPDTITASGTDGELLLTGGSSAQHDFGVLSLADNERYVFGLRTNIDSADLSLTLLINGVAVQTQDVVYDEDDPNDDNDTVDLRFGGVVFELGALDLSGFTDGVSTVSIRVNNDGADDVLLDDFFVTGGVYPDVEEFGLRNFDPSGLSGAVSASVGPVSIDVAGVDATTLSQLAAALQAVTTIDVFSLEANSFVWALDAPTSFFDFLALGQTGVVSFDVTLSGADGGSVTEAIEIQITGDNQGPQAPDQSFNGTEDEVLEGQLVASDIDGDALTFELVDRPQNGSVTINTDGSFTFIPAEDSTATETFTYEVTDPSGASAVGTVTIQLSGVNDAPENLLVDLSRTVSASPGDTVAVSLLGLLLDDVDADELSLILDPQGSGTIAYDATEIAAAGLRLEGGNLTGAIADLNAFFSGGGAAQFTDTSGTDATILATVTDNGDSGTGGPQTISVGEVSVDVDGVPVAAPLDVQVSEDSEFRGSLPGNDPDGDDVTFSLAANAANGIVKITSDGAFTYTPFTNFNGTDSFEYAVSDGNSTDTAVVTVTVLDTEDLPLVRDEFAFVDEDGSVSRELDGLNPNGGRVFFALADGGAPLLGDVVIEDDGDFTYTPDPNVTGTDSFTFTVSDGVNFVTGIATIEIRPVQDVPEVVEEIETVAEDEVLEGQLEASDADGETLTFALAEDGAAANGSVTIELDGGYTYTPDPDYNGPDSFTYTVTDGVDVVIATATITVTPVNDPPVIAPLDVSVDEDGTITETVTATDVDGDFLTFALVEGSGPSLGSVDVEDDGSFTYTPDADVNGVDTFEVSVDDGTVTATTVVTVTIDPVNDAPVAVDDEATTKEDTPILLSLAANDTDIDGGPLVVSEVGSPAQGTAEVTAEGEVIYTPEVDFFGTDSFTYTVSDGRGGFDTATAFITIIAQGEIPVVGTDGDDVFRIRRDEGRDVAFDGLEGMDTVLNTDRHRDFNLTDSSFHSIEIIDGNGRSIEVDRDGRLDLSEVETLIDVDGIEGDKGDESIIGSQDDDLIEAGAGNDTLEGGVGNDTLEGGPGADQAFGGAGDDLFLVETSGDGDDDYGDGDGDGDGDGPDLFDGGEGEDTILNTRKGKDINLTGATFESIEIVDGNNGAITVSKDGTLDLSGIGQLIDVDAIEGASGDESITGSDDDDLILGKSGDDSLEGGAGNDTLDGGAGADASFGGAGDDVFVIDVSGDGDDDYGDGDDDGDDDYAPADPGGHFDGGEGFDTLLNTKRNKDFSLDGASFESIERLDGNGGALRVKRDGFIDLSSIEEVVGVPKIRGDKGDETFIGSQDDDRIDGERGYDTVIVQGLVENFDFDIQGRGKATISGDGIGTDRLEDIEEVVFDDYTLFLDGRNNAPVGRADSVSTDEDTLLTVAVAALLANDFDPEGDDFSLTGVSSDEIAIGLNVARDVTINPTGAFDELADGQTQTVAARYTTADENGAEGGGRIEITVIGVNDAPVAVADSFETAEEIPVDGNLLANDTDIDNGAVLTVVAIEGDETAVGRSFTLASGATVTVEENGDFTYDPGDNFAKIGVGATAIDSFTYTITDEEGGEATATATITINGDNDAATANDDDYEVVARRVFFTDATGGIVINDIDIDIGDELFVADVLGGTPTTFTLFEDGEFVDISKFVGTGSTGGQFAIAADGSITFDSGRDFDDLDAGETRETTITYTVSDGNGSEDEATVTIVVSAADLAPPSGPSGPFDKDAADLQTVAGSFDQLGGVDVVEELFQRLTGDQTLDLDTIFDLDLVDIDTTFDVSFSPQDGLNVDITDNNPQSDAILTGFGDELNLAADFVTDLINPVITAPVTPVFFGPEFDLSATIQAQFGWDVTAPTLGKTAIFQPVTFDLFTPEGTVDEFGNFQLFSDNLISDTPTVAIQTVGLGDIRVDAGFALADARIKDIGFVIGTQDFLGLDLDGLAFARLGLAGEIDLAEALGEVSPVPLENAFSISGRDILDGLASIGPQEFLDAIQALATDPGTDTAQDLGRLILRAIDIASQGAATLYTIKTAELSASQLAELRDRSRFNEFDGFDAAGVGFFDLIDTAGEAITVTRADVEAVMEFNGITDALDELVNLLGEDGFTVIDGLTIKATLPIGNIEEIDGFDDGTGFGPRSGEQQITVEQVTRLAGVEIDFEKIQSALAELAIDQAIEQSLKKPSKATPIIVGAGLGAKVALLLQPKVTEFFEAGFTDTTQIQPLALVAAAFNPLIDLLNSVTGLVNVVLGAIGLPEIPQIERLTVESLGAAFDAVIDTLADGIITILGAISSVASEVLGFLANNPVTEAIDTALNFVKNVVTDGVGTAINALEDAIDTVGRALGLGDALDFLDAIFDVARAGNQAVADFSNVVSSLFQALADAQAEVSQFLQDGVDTFRDTLKNIARGVELSVDTSFNQFEFTIDAGFDLVQRATFNPDEVDVTYSVDGFDVTTGLGEAATFFADGAAGDVLDGQVTYNFSGDVDYDYILRLEITPELTLYGFEVQGDLSLGTPGEGESYNFNFEYAGVKITDDFGLEELGALELTELFDDALIELPFGLVEEVAEVVADQIRDSLGGFAGQTSDLDFNEFRLFELEDVNIDQDQFTSITQDFQIEIGGATPEPVVVLTYSEDATGELAENGLLDGVDPGSTLSKVEDSALNIDRFIELETGGRLLIDRDGGAVFVSDGDYEFLAVGQTDTTTIDFSVEQPDGFQRTFQATIVIEGENDAPVAVEDFATTLEETSVEINVLSNDFDVDTGDNIRILSASSDFGEAVLDVTNVLFTPEEDFFGEAVVTYTIADDSGSETEGTVTVTVINTPDPVEAEDDILVVNEDSFAAIDVALNDIEPDGDAIEVRSLSLPARGTAFLTGTSTVVFVALGAFEELAVGETAIETIDVTVADPDGEDDSVLTVVIEGTNDGPEANDDTASTKEDVPLLLDLAANDTDIDGDSLVVISVTDPVNGHAEVTEEGQVLYTPDHDFFGTDTLTYTVSDGFGGTDTASVEISIKAQGETTVTGTNGDDVFRIQKDEGRNVNFDGGEGDDLILNTKRGKDINLTDTSFHGIETIDANHADIDVDKNGRIDLSHVQNVINVGAIEGKSGDEVIIGSQDDDLIEARNGDDFIEGGLGNDTIDAGKGNDESFGGLGDDIFVVQSLGDGDDDYGDGDGDYGDGDGDDDYGDGDGDGDGDVDLYDGGEGIDIVLNAKRNKDFSLDGDIFVDVEVLDGNGGDLRVKKNGFIDLSEFEETRNLPTIRGNKGNETFIGSQDDDYIDGSWGRDDTVIIRGEVRDFDIQLFPWRKTIISGPGIGTDTLKRIERVEFDDYTLFNDGRNNAPILFADAFETDEDTALVISDKDLLANDIDLDRDNFSLTGVSSDEISVSSTPDGVITIDPDGAFETLAHGETDIVEISYTVEDSEGASSTGSAEVTITGVNDGPVAAADAVETSEEVSVTGNVLDNDSDVDNGAVLRVTALNGGAPGETTLASGALVTLLEDGGFVYDPGDNFAFVGEGDFSTDTFTYTVSDEFDAEATATVTVTIAGDNEAPTDEGETYIAEANTTLEVDAVDGLLANAADEDVGDVLSVAGADGVVEIAGDKGGTFILAADGSFVFETGNDFNFLRDDETETTSLTYIVQDDKGGVTSSTVEVVVEASEFTPTPNPGPSPFPFVARNVVGTFEQLGGVDAATELFSDLVGQPVDLDTIFDITFIDIDKTILFQALPNEDFNFQIIDNTPPEGELGGLNEAIDAAFTTLGTGAGFVIPLDLGPVEVQPTFDVAVELDIAFGIDVDLPTLGKAAFFQPIELTLLAPEQVAAGESFLLRSQDLVSQTPTTVIETIGLGSIDIESEFSISDSTIGGLGYAIQSSDFGPFQLDGLASKALVFNADFTLGDVIEETKQFIADIVDDITSVFGDQLPFDPSEILDTLFSLDVNNIVTNILAGQIDIQALIETITTSADAKEVADALLDLINTLSQDPEPEPTTDLNGAALTSQDLYELTKRSLFNEFDLFLADGTGVFELDVLDEDGDPTGDKTTATEQEVQDRFDLLGIEARITEALDAIRGLTLAPFDGLEVNFALPLENLEIIEGFGTSDAGDVILGPQDGETTIQVRQETSLFEVEIDFEQVAVSLVEQLLDAAANTSPQARALRTYLEFAQQALGAAEEGVEVELALRPAELVTVAVNGVVQALNAAGNALDSIIPGDIFDEIPEISNDATLAVIDAAIDATITPIVTVFEALEVVIDSVADFLGTLLDVAAGGLTGIADGLDAIIDFFGGGIQGAINALESVRDFGFTIPNPLPFCSDIEVKPFKGIVGGAVSLLEGLQFAINQAGNAVDGIRSFAGEIENTADSLRAFSIDDALSQPIEDFKEFLKDLARGADLNAQLSLDLFEASLDASLSVVQIAEFNPDDVEVTYDVAGFDIDAGLGDTVGMSALGEAGETLTGTAEYTFSGEVDYEYRLALDLDPTFKFFEASVLAELFVGGDQVAGENNETVFEENFAIVSIADEGSPTAAENALIDIEFDFTNAVTETIEDAFAATLGQVVPGDVEFEDGELFLFAVEDVVLDDERFTTIREDFTIELV